MRFFLSHAQNAAKSRIVVNNHFAGIATAETACEECGTISSSGQRSCCGTGGSWSGKCGKADDADAEHTWMEGIQACENTDTEGIVIVKMAT